jgi:hypothetical protein
VEEETSTNSGSTPTPPIEVDAGRVTLRVSATADTEVMAGVIAAVRRTA